MQTYSTECAPPLPLLLLYFLCRMDEAYKAALGYSQNEDLKFSPSSYKKVWHHWLNSSRFVDNIIKANFS